MFSDVYFPRVNGVSTSIETFRSALAARGVRVFLVAPAYGEHSTENDITRIPSRSILFDPEDRMMRYGLAKELPKVLKSHKIDLVHIQTPFVAYYAGIKMAKTLRVPSVVTYHTFFEEYLYHYIPFVPSRWMQALARRFSRTQCNGVDAVIVPSTAMEERLRAYGVRRPIHRIPTGIPQAQFEPGNGEEFRRQHNIAPARPMVLFLGRVAFEKNLEFLLRAINIARNEIPDLLFVIAGEGPAVPKLQQLADQLGMQETVKFIGYLSRNGALRNCYSAADAFVFASRTETQGLVLLEAMALGVPVVSTAVMGTRDILAPSCGAVVAPDNLQGFADSVVKLMKDRELRARLAAEAPQCARVWGADVMAEKLHLLYLELASTHVAG